jgi:hypothetical protein
VRFIWFIAAVLWAGSASAAYNDPIACIQLPALIGDTTTSAGSCATTGNLDKISTQTASNSATLQWTGLTTYNNYYLSCYQVYPASTAQTLFIQLGQGGIPTWKTSGYQYSGLYVASNSSTVGGLNNNADSGHEVAGNTPNSVTAAINFTALMTNLQSSTGYKGMYTFAHTFQPSSSLAYFSQAATLYTADTVAATALRLQFGSGNITGGTCTLYALVQ